MTVGQIIFWCVLFVISWPIVGCIAMRTYNKLDDSWTDEDEYIQAAIFGWLLVFAYMMLTIYLLFRAICDKFQIGSLSKFLWRGLVIAPSEIIVRFVDRLRGKKIREEEQ